MAVTYELDGGVARLTIDDGKANAITLELLGELDKALSRADGEAGAVLLTGRPGRFSAGFDLSVMTKSDSAMRELVSEGCRFLMRFFTYPLPTVVACTGHALAMGSLVLLAADHRIGVDGEFKVGLNEVAIGMPLPHFAIELARYRMPPSRFDGALLGEVHRPAGAVEAGYLDRAVAPEALVEEAAAFAARCSGLQRSAVQRSKQIAREELVQRVLARLESDLAGVGRPTG